MIATAPHFQPLTLEHKDLVRQVTTRFVPYSDFNFTSLYSWNVDQTTEIAEVHSNLVIKFPHYLTGDPVVSLLGDNRIDETLAELLDAYSAVELVPEAVVDHIKDRKRFQIAEDRDNFDYLYDANHITEMTGQVFKKKRNKVHHVESTYGKRLSLSVAHTRHDFKDIEDAFWIWAEENDRERSDAQAEFIALRQSLRRAKELDIVVTLIRIDGILCGFSVNELLPNGFAVCHFEKAMSAHKDMASFVAHAAATELHARGCTLLNWEQDLGIAGLRQAKLSWQPVGFLKKYTITAPMLYS